MLSLADFDKDFFESLEDKEKIFLKGEQFHTLIFNDEKIGIIGIVPPNFVQLIIKSNFRGKGFYNSAMDLIMDYYKFDSLQGTIDLENFAALKAAKKYGFVILPDEKMDNLRQKGFLQENQIRFVKLKK